MRRSSHVHRDSCRLPAGVRLVAVAAGFVLAGGIALASGSGSGSGAAGNPTVSIQTATVTHTLPAAFFGVGFGMNNTDAGRDAGYASLVKALAPEIVRLHSQEEPPGVPGTPAWWLIDQLGLASALAPGGTKFTLQLGAWPQASGTANSTRSPIDPGNIDAGQRSPANQAAWAVEFERLLPGTLHSVEPYNEPATQGLSGAGGWYGPNSGAYSSPSSTARYAADWASFHQQYYYDALKAAAPPSTHIYGAVFATVDNSYAAGEIARFLDGQSWPGFPAGGNVSKIDALAFHGYNYGLPTGNAAADYFQGYLNSVFYPTYTLGKGGFFAAAERFRSLLDARGGQSVMLAPTEAGNTRNEAPTALGAWLDAGLAITSANNQARWKLDQMSYHAINPDPVDGNLVPYSGGGGNGMIVLETDEAYHTAVRYELLRDIVGPYLHGYKRQVAFSVANTVLSPASPAANAVPNVQLAAGLNPSGSRLGIMLLNANLLGPQTITINLDAAPVGPITGRTMPQGQAYDAALPEVTPFAAGASFSYTLSAGSVTLLEVPLTAAGVLPSGLKPTSTFSPRVSAGSALGTQLTLASPGGWAGSPTSFTYQWQRCDPAGVPCTPIAGATGTSYTLTSDDAGTSTSVLVTAGNAYGSTTAASRPNGQSVAPPVVVPDPTGIYDGYVIDADCVTCTVTVDAAAGITARIVDGADSRDTAYAFKVLGGAGGLAGRVYVRTVLGLAVGQALSANLSVFRMLDAADKVVYELYVGPDRTLYMYSPPGGLRGAALNQTLGVVVPNDGTAIRVEVSALAGTSVTARVDGVDRFTFSSLGGATTGNQRVIVAGIDHYDANVTIGVVSVSHAAVGASQAGWLGSTTVPTPPSNSVAPTVTGSPLVGLSLSAAPGTWSGNPAPTFGYEWLRCDSGGANCAPVPGATGQAYTLVGADAGLRIVARVTATNTVGAAQAVSAATSVVTVPTPPQSLTAPVVSGSALTGQSLTATSGSWSGSPAPSFAFQWLRCDSAAVGCAEIAGAVGQSYVLVTADVGSRVAVRVTASNVAGSGAAVSVATAVVTAPLIVNLIANPDFESDPSAVWASNGPGAFSWASDVARSGSRSLKIVSSSGSALSRWMGSVPAVAGKVYDVSGWLRSSGVSQGVLSVVVFAGGTALGTFDSSSRLSGTQDWTQLAVRLTAPAGTTSLRVELRLWGLGTLWGDDVSVSDGSAPPPPPVAPLNSVLPVVSGSLVVGQSLSATTGTWSGSPAPSFGFQWLRCDAVGAGCVAIVGASAQSYGLVAADQGVTVAVRVTASNSGGSASADSVATAVVQPAPAVVNLIANPDFESDPSAAWASNGPGTFSWASDAAHSGSRSLKVSVPSGGSLSRWMGSINVTPRTQYDVAAWLKSQGIPGGGGQLVVTFWAAGQVYIAGSATASLQTLGGTQDWTQLALIATAPAGAVTMRVELRLGGAGTLWADDVFAALH